MYTLYSLLLTLGFIILLPKFAFDALRSGKYVTGLRQRLGNLSPAKSGNPVIWLHCVSVGEAQAAHSLIRALAQKFPRHDLAISTTTVTGQKMARSLFAEQAAAIFYFPIDWAWTVRRTLRIVQPSAVFVMETEVWPRLFRECRKAGIPIALLNGRLSEKSFRRYTLVRSFISRVLNDLTFAAVQTSEDADRFRELGLASDRIEVLGNLKFDSASISTDKALTEEIRRRFGLNKRPVMVVASTHNPEESIVLQAFRETRHAHPGTRLVLAPRHPERFDEVAAMLENSGFTVARRSARQSNSDAQSDIVLLDTIGELRAVYPLADIVFMGGSLIPHGGQNVIEPAAHGVCTITGPHTQNFAAVTKALLDEDALIQLSSTATPANELGSVLTQLLSDDKRRNEIGERARAVCYRNQGATERSIELISQILSAPARGGQQIPFSTFHVTTAK